MSTDKKINIFDLNDIEQITEFTDLTVHALESDGELGRIEKMLDQEILTECRVAQSIITRSEVELFGVSSPRLATRVYLRGGGFINYRRLRRLENNIPRHANGSYGQRYPDGSIDERYRNLDLKPKEFPWGNTNRNSIVDSIADCILRAPLRLIEKYGFNFLKVNEEKLFQAYSETLEKTEPPAIFTPFAQPSAMGGGQCAQASCFTATAILSHCSSSLCGIAEITAYAHPVECCEFSISGLTQFKMNRYFESVGLRMSVQSTYKDGVVSLLEDERLNLATSLRSYLNSNMPVIYPVDCRRMQDGKVYSENGLKLKKTIVRKEPHVVTLVGFQKDLNYFAFHDPAFLPYMTISITNLADVSCDRDDQIQLRDAGVFMPVTPAEVRMPLGWQRIQTQDGGQFEPHIGLLTISSTLKKINRLGFPQKRSEQLSKMPFILAQKLAPENFDALFRTVEEKFHSKTWVDNLVNEANNLISEIKLKRKWQRDKWHWFEIFYDGVLIWNAELSPPKKMPQPNSKCFDFLVGLVVQRNEHSYESIEIEKD